MTLADGTMYAHALVDWCVVARGMNGKCCRMALIRVRSLLLLLYLLLCFVLWFVGLSVGRCSLLARYSGEWSADVPHGRGTLIRPDGLSFSGLWAHGLFDGRGDCQYPDGSSFQGTFKSGLRDGRGTLTFPNAVVYNGRFREDHLEGSGLVSIPHPVPACDGTDAMLVPVSLQADLHTAHLRAGFSSSGL